MICNSRLQNRGFWQVFIKVQKSLVKLQKVRATGYEGAIKLIGQLAKGYQIDHPTYEGAIKFIAQPKEGYQIDRRNGSPGRLPPVREVS